MAEGIGADLGLTQMAIHGRKAGRLEHLRHPAAGAVESAATRSPAEEMNCLETEAGAKFVCEMQ